MIGFFLSSNVFEGPSDSNETVSSAWADEASNPAASHPATDL
jgi:hypothetical protein